MNHAETAGLTPREPEKTFEEILVAIGDSLSDLASSDDGKDGEDEYEEIEYGKLSDDDEPGRVMGTNTQTIQQYSARILQKQMKVEELTELGWEDAADYFRPQDQKYGTSELRMPAGLQPQMDDNAPAPPPTSLGELLECLAIVSGISQIL
jgi:hypothetical protein